MHTGRAANDETIPYTGTYSVYRKKLTWSSFSIYWIKRPVCESYLFLGIKSRFKLSLSVNIRGGIKIFVATV